MIFVFALLLVNYPFSPCTLSQVIHKVYLFTIKSLRVSRMNSKILFMNSTV